MEESKKEEYEPAVESKQEENNQAVAKKKNKKKKKKVNKEAKEQQKSKGNDACCKGHDHDHDHSHEHGHGHSHSNAQSKAKSENDVYSNQLAKLLNESKAILSRPPNFENYEKFSLMIKDKINGIQSILDKINNNQFEGIPDEEVVKNENQKPTPNSEKKTKALNDMTDKINYLKSKRAYLLKEFIEDPSQIETKDIATDIIKNIDDDIKRSEELYQTIIYNYH